MLTGLIRMLTVGLLLLQLSGSDFSSNRKSWLFFFFSNSFLSLLNMFITIVVMMVMVVVMMAALVMVLLFVPGLLCLVDVLLQLLGLLQSPLVLEVGQLVGVEPGAERLDVRPAGRGLAAGRLLLLLPLLVTHGRRAEHGEDKST